MLLQRTKKNRTFSIALLISVIFSCKDDLMVTDEFICNFTVTNTVGEIVGSDDQSDWQPRLIPDSGLPASLAVAPAYPNPAGVDSVVFGDNPRIGCVITYAVAASLQSVQVVVDNGLTLVDDIQTAGFHAIFWDLQDDSGQPLPEGCYRITITSTTNDTTLVSTGDIQIER